jgi:hypothetical protein
MLFGETADLNCENHTERINSLLELKGEFLKLKLAVHIKD